MTIEGLEKARLSRIERGPLVHLFRGAPAVRSWSKHKQTIRDWSLCGIEWDKNAERTATEDETEVTCQFCLQLLT